MDAGDARRAILERLQRGVRLRLRARAVLPAQMGRGRLPPEQLKIARGLRAGPGHQKEELREAQAAHAAVRRLSLRARCEVFHVHGTSGTTGRPTAFAHRPRRLARDRQRACAHHVGHGHPARRHDLRRRRSSASTWVAGARSPAPSGSAPRRFPFGAGVAGHDARAACSGCAQMQAAGLLRHADLRAAPGPGRRRGGPRPARLRLPHHVLLRRARRLDPGGARQDRGALRRQGVRLRLDGGDDAVDERRRSAPRRRACCAGRTSSTPRSAIPRRMPARALRRSGARRSTRISSAPRSR